MDSSAQGAEYLADFPAFFFPDGACCLGLVGTQLLAEADQAVFALSSHDSLGIKGPTDSRAYWYLSQSVEFASLAL